MKRIVLLLISILLLTGCTQEASQKQDDRKDVVVYSQGGDYGFSIIYNKRTIGNGFEEFIYLKAREYMQATGLTVEVIGVDGLSVGEYNTKLNSKLLLEDGPTILYENRYNYSYWKDKPFINPQDKIENYKNIYEPLQSNKYIPITASIPTTTLNIKKFKELGVDYNKLDAKSYYETKKEFLKGKKRDMDYIEFEELYSVLIDDVKFVDEDGFLSLTNDSVLNFIEAMKNEMISNTYDMPVFLNFEEIEQYFIYPDKEQRTEAQKRRTKRDNYLLPTVTTYNALDVRRLCDYNKEPLTTFAPPFLKRCDAWYHGFLINPNGKNIDEAAKFLNGLLSKESQTQIMYTYKGGYGTVIKGMEDIKKTYYEKTSIVKESTDVMDATYDKLLNGYYEIFYHELVIDVDFKRAILKYVLTDEYKSIDEIKDKLKMLEDKLNFYH